MPKHNQFIKKLKSQFVSINNTIESYFNNLKFLIKNLKKRKLSQNNKAFLISALIVISIISYYLIPTIYNKEFIQLEIIQSLRSIPVFRLINIHLSYSL